MLHCARRWWTVWLVCVLAGCGGSEATPQLKKLNVQSRLDVASAAEAAGVGTVATNMLAEAAAAAPDTAKVQQRYIRALVDAGRISEARQVLAKASGNLPDDLTLRYEEARLDILEGEPRRALALLEQIVRAQPENIKAWCAKGVALDLLGNSSAADRAYERAANLAPYDRIVANDRAVSLLLRGQPGAARNLLRGAARQNPPDNRITNNLALADGLAGNLSGVADLLGDGAEAKIVAEAARVIGSSDGGGLTSIGSQKPPDNSGWRLGGGSE
jgi:Flp pilus assembly protein TadD